jgi:hypothetical protein
MRFWIPPPDEEARHTGTGVGTAILLAVALLAAAFAWVLIR